VNTAWFNRWALGLSLVGVLATATAQDLVAVPALSQRVTDLAGLLSLNDATAIEQKLIALEKDSGHQLAVLTVPTTKPEAIETFSYRVAEQWKIGHKGADNGALLIIAKNDKKIRIEVGRGLEGVLTDVQSRRIIGDVMAPFFKQGQFSQGVSAGVDSMILTMSKEKIDGPWRHGNEGGVIETASGLAYKPWVC
jgi:uncharacterized protein